MDVHADGAARIGRYLASLYAGWTEDSFVLEAKADELIAASLAQASPWVGNACRAVAAHTQGWAGHPYHGHRHHGEVATSAVVLAWLGAHDGAHTLDADELGLLVCACLGHDVGYDPAIPRQAYRLETLAAQQVDAVLDQACVGPAIRMAVGTLILATEPSARTWLRTLCARARNTEPSNGGFAPIPDLPQQLGPLAADTRLLELAAILSDADLLGSAGLTPQWSAVQSARLARETGQPSTPQRFARFLELGVGPDWISRGGAMLDSNLETIRDWNARLLPPIAQSIVKS